MAQSWAGIALPLRVATPKVSSNGGGPPLKTLRHVTAPGYPAVSHRPSPYAPWFLSPFPPGSLSSSPVSILC